MNVLLGVTGSIACYKSYDIARELVKKGHNVKVILTSGALEFIKPDTYKYLGVQDVLLGEDDFNIHKNQGQVLHIELKNWADLILVSPVSANKLAEFANGICRDLLTSVFLSAQEKNKILFPAMNTQMLNNNTTKRNIQTLSDLPNTYIHPTFSGELICKDIGEGKLPPVDYIVDFIEHFSFNSKEKNILITTGATIAPLDPVRYITNPSTGKTGYELAKSFLGLGFKVTLIYGSNSTKNIENLSFNPNFVGYKVFTTKDMFEVVKNEFNECDLFISSAAVSDIKFKTQTSKLKKDGSNPSLDFEWDTDILANCIKNKNKQKIVSFAAETDNLEQNFANKWNKKPTDLLIGNKVHMEQGHNSSMGFGQDQNQYYFVQDAKIVESKNCTKVELAKEIINRTLKND